MDLWRIAVRALIAYIFLLFMTRVSGKRVVSQATPFDLVVSLIIGDLIDDALWADVSVAKFSAAAGSIFLADILVMMAAFRSPRFYRLVNGVPRVVLRNGRAIHDAMRREQFNDDDLDHLLRLDGIDQRKKVKLATIELDHEASAILRPEEEPATRADADRVKEMLP